MTETLFDLTLKTAIALGIVRQGVATGGATNSVIDTNLLADVDDDYFNDGTVWITAAGGAAPEKEYSVVSDFTASTDTITPQDAFSQAVAAGDRYAVAIRRYPLYQLIQMINDALYMDGYIPVTDTSLTTVADQREYTLPQAATLDLRTINIYTNDDSDRNIPRPAYNYELRYSATGSPETVVFNQDYTAGQTIEVVYAALHGDLSAADDELNDAIHPDRIVYTAAANAMRQYRDRTRLKHLDRSIDILEQKAELARQRHPLPVLPPRRSKIGIFGNFIPQVGY